MKIINANDLLKRINNAENNFKADHMEELENGDSFCDGVLSAVFNIREMVKQADDVNTQMHQIIKWIPVKFREATEEEKEKCRELYGYEIENTYDCPLPDHGQDVLITTCYGDVKIDTFYNNIVCYFENYCDDEDVVAWAELPMPYNKKL